MILTLNSRQLFAGFKWLLLLSLVHFSSIGQSQIPVTVMAGQNQFQHDFFFFKDFDKQRKFNIFTMGQFAVDYDQAAFNSSSISSQITYNLTPFLGISGGATFANQQFRPLVALSLSYMNKKKDLLINVFPSLIIKDTPEYEMFGLLLYTPKLSERFSLFTQVMFNTTMDEKWSQHLFSFQQIRIGVGYRDWFQVGVGIDQNFVGPEYTQSHNIGVFLRKQF